MADVIELLSSDDEKDPEPPKKKQKISQDVILLTDDDDEMQAKDPPISIKAAVDDTKEELVDPLHQINLNDHLDNETEDPLTVTTAAEETTDPDESLVDDIYNVTDDEDDSTSKDSKENKPSASNIKQIKISDGVTVVNQPSEMSEELQKFIDACRRAIQDTSRRKVFEEKVPLLMKRFKRAEDYTQTEDCKSKINNLTEKILLDPKKAIPLFHEMFLDLQANAGSDERTQRVLDKLYRRLDQLEKRVKQLEVREVDFDEDEDSSYIMMQKYREHTMKVLKKIKTLEKSDWRQGLTYYNRLDYAKSQYPEINRAINRRFQCREKDPFPTFASVDKCVRKCVTNNKMNWNEATICLEVKRCFEGLGNLLQRRRRTDLAQNHYCFLTGFHTDPATTDKDLENKLKENRKVANTNLSHVLEKFVALQETGIDPTLSADSDDSDHKESDED